MKEVIQKYVDELMEYRKQSNDELQEGIKGALWGGLIGSLFAPPIGTAVGVGLGYMRQERNLGDTAALGLDDCDKLKNKQAKYKCRIQKYQAGISVLNGAISRCKNTPDPVGCSQKIKEKIMRYKAKIRLLEKGKRDQSRLFD